MKNYLLPLIILCAPLGAGAEEAPVRFSPAQLKSLAIVSQALAGFEARGERRLPAQVVVPPGQVEVVAAPLGGLVTAVLAAYGEPVRKGQVLARLQSPQLLELQRDLVQTRAQAEVAADNLRRDEALFAEGIIAGARVAASRSAERQAAAQFAERRQALRLAGVADPGPDLRGLSGTAELRAPIDGVVLEATVQPGQRVDAALPLFRLGRLSPLWLEIQATPEQAAGLMPGDPVRVSGCTQPGRITLVAPHLNPATQSLLLRAELDKPGSCVKPFQFVQAQVTAARPTAGNSWRVPSGALVRHQGQVWLFAEASGGFRPVPAKVLEETEKATLVAADLAADTRIVVQGTAAVKAAWLGLGAGEAK
jgi:RND family efflux transporter MFP subunit